MSETPDTTTGIGFRAYYADGRRVTGTSLAAWQAMPATGLVLVDVLEPKEYAPGRPYRWRMECEYFGCREGANGLEFRRWHEETSPPCCQGWDWKQGLLIADEAMAQVRAEAE